VSRGLTEADLAAFARIGVPAEEIVKANIRRVTHAEASAILGTSRWGDMAGILFPYLDPITKQSVTVRLRRDHPEVDSQGKAQNKYLSAYGDRRHLYFPWRADSLLALTNAPVVMVEAEKSALAIAALASRIGRPMLAIACGGCWGWRGRTGIADGPHGERLDEKGPLPDLALVGWDGRGAFICFDADARTNAEVRQARYALGQELHGRCARVRIVELPELEGINGPDDLIGLCGDAAFLALLEAASSLPESALADAGKALAELGADPEQASDPKAASRLLETVSAVADPTHRRLFEKKTAKVLQWPIADVRKRVEMRVAERQEAAADAKEKARKGRLRALKLDRSALTDLERFFEERAYLPADAALVLVFFTLNTWVFDLFDTTPYLLLDSATPRCGKNTVMSLLEAVCACPQMLTSASEAALFRSIDRNRPTVLLDEAELLGGHGDRAEYLRSIVHAGYKKGGKVPRVVGQEHELQYFDVFCPKVFAAIGGFTGALLDRTIVIHMERAPANHVRKSIRQRQLKRDSAQFREWIEAYAEQSREALAELYANEADEGYWPELRDREAELWGPLLIHAKLIGPQWEARLLAAAVSFSRAKAEILAQDYNVALSNDLLEAIEQLEGERFAPVDLIPHLEGEAWGQQFSKCKDDTAKAAKVGKFLGRFRLSSRVHTRTGTTYLRQEAMEKLAAHIPARTVTAVTPVTEQAESAEDKLPSDTVTDVTSPAGAAASTIPFPEMNAVAECDQDVVAANEIEI
jgi:Domain of unknown function (DUF3854)/Protein of unknown function (DUF3631)